MDWRGIVEAIREGKELSDYPVGTSLSVARANGKEPLKLVVGGYNTFTLSDGSKRNGMILLTESPVKGVPYDYLESFYHTTKPLTKGKYYLTLEVPDTKYVMNRYSGCSYTLEFEEDVPENSYFVLNLADNLLNRYRDLTYYPVSLICEGETKETIKFRKVREGENLGNLTMNRREMNSLLVLNNGNPSYKTSFVRDWANSLGGVLNPKDTFQYGYTLPEGVESGFLEDIDADFSKYLLPVQRAVSTGTETETLNDKIFVINQTDYSGTGKEGFGSQIDFFRNKPQYPESFILASNDGEGKLVNVSSEGQISSISPSKSDTYILGMVIG